ncbi:hypothetical protein EIM50_24860 [Pseudoxanthomonas sp. SGD-10]|nr:hypothetical protein EIM50_24860 [Pseudoxanthomonas sp. SGD-10]
MNTLFFRDSEYLPFNRENFLDFPLLAAFLRGKHSCSLFEFEELNSGIEDRKFDEDRQTDHLSEK